MEKKHYRFVIIDDNPIDIKLISRYIESVREWDAEVFPVTSLEIDTIASFCQDADIVFLDYLLGGERNGLEIFNRLKELRCGAPVVMLTGCGNEMVAVEAMKSGIIDYVVKESLSIETVRRVVDYAVEKATLERKTEKQINALKKLVIKDPLSGLYNRRYFFERLNYEFNRSVRYLQPFSALLIDFDHFKTINDTYGHHTGDAVLSGAAAIIQKNIRLTDIAARYGGEEFCLILPDTGLKGAVAAGEKIRRQIEIQPFRSLDGEEIHITISAGAAQFYPKDKTADELMVRADKALYQAKAAGRNRIVPAGEEAGHPGESSGNANGDL